MDKAATFIADGASSSTSSPIRSFAFECADTAIEDFEDDWDDPVGSVAGSSSTFPSPRIPGLQAGAFGSPRVVQCPSPPRATLKSFKLLDFDAFSEDDVVE